MCARLKPYEPSARMLGLQFAIKFSSGCTFIAWRKRALGWHGKGDVGCDTVPGLKIEDRRDARGSSYGRAG